MNYIQVKVYSSRFFEKWTIAGVKSIVQNLYLNINTNFWILIIAYVQLKRLRSPITNFMRILYQIYNNKFMNTQEYDLAIIGAGCMGVAAAYYAVKQGIKKVILIEKDKIGIKSRYSILSARQNRVQYNEEYLTRFVVESNKEWDNVEKDLGQKFLHKQGALWFGNKNTSTNQGNIKAANAVVSSINSSVKKNSDRIQSLYMQKIMQNSPNFMKAFKPNNKDKKEAESEWDAWSALYQPDGGSVNMQASYNKFMEYAKNKGVAISDQTTVISHTEIKYSEYKNKFCIKQGCNQEKQIVSKKVLITVGVYTPYFMKHIMKSPALADEGDKQFVIQEYVASYIKILDNPENIALYNNIPNYYNFLKSDGTKDQQFSGYGFRYHDWDNQKSQSGSKFVKFGTLACNNLKQGQLNNAYYDQVPTTDHRVKQAIRFINNRMNGLLPEDPENKHLPCSNIFYTGRQTILDYLNRKEQSVVIQSGGWIGKYFPLLAKTAISMLFDYKNMDKVRKDETSVIGNFINRTRFPIKRQVKEYLYAQNSEGKTHFDTLIVGAGCSGLYTGLRLNEEKRRYPQKKQVIGKIGIFDLGQRISGRLKSFYFQGVTTPIQLGGMRYIPSNHILVNKIITELGIPYVKFPMDGDPIQNHSRKAFLRNDYYNMDQWSTNQKIKSNLQTSYRIEGPIMGMDAFQIISFSLYMIVTAPQNRNLLTEVFLQKTDAQIDEQKGKYAQLGDNVHYQKSWYRTWTNYVYQDKQNQKVFNVNLNLRQWNQLKPVILFRFRFSISNKDIYTGQQKKTNSDIYPLYKFGFQNVIQSQFSHEAYQFVSEQNGYFSNTSNASYLDQVMAYLLDFGDVIYRSLSDGYDQINYAMANILLDGERGFQNADQGIFLNHKLVDILPSDVQGTKYIAVFHVPHVNKQKNYRNTPIFHCKGVKKSKVAKLGVSTQIPGSEGYRQIRFTTNRIILGMPKKSVTNLISEIQILRKPLQSYHEIYQSQRAQFETIFSYKSLGQYVSCGQNVCDLNQQEKQRLIFLEGKQQLSFSKPEEKLTQAQKAQLQSLSNRQFLKSLKLLSNQDSQFEKNKRCIFQRNPPKALNDLSIAADSTQIMPAVRIVMNFDRNWWDPNNYLNKQYQQKYKNSNLVNSVQNMRGVSVTDLPMRQALYFSQGEDNLLLGSYNDMITTQFWKTLHENFSQVWTPSIEPKKISCKIKYPGNCDIDHAKKVLVKELIKELSLVHQLQVDQSWLKECVYQFWGNDPYGGGYHNFYSGYYVPTVMKIIRKPFTNQNIHIVGEAYSNETGWVQGCFQTCQMLIQQELGVSELVPGYYAGY